MPSKRMVPEQDVFEVEERLVRLAAAKDAEIAMLRAELDEPPELRHHDQCPACFWHPGHDPEEWFREEKELRSAALKAAQAEIAMLVAKLEGSDEEHERSSEKIAALTEQRDRWKADCEDITTCLNNERAKFMELLTGLTEQRDRAMKVVEAARTLKFGAYPAHGSGFVSIVIEGNPTELADALAALDAEAETEGQ